MRDFEALPHTADLKIRVYGASLLELFTNALIGMFQSIEPAVPQCSIVHDRVQCDTLPVEHTISVSAPEVDLLLIDFNLEAALKPNLLYRLKMKAQTALEALQNLVS